MAFEQGRLNYPLNSLYFKKLKVDFLEPFQLFCLYVSMRPISAYLTMFSELTTMNRLLIIYTLYFHRHTVCYSILY